MTGLSRHHRGGLSAVAVVLVAGLVACGSGNGARSPEPTISYRAVDSATGKPVSLSSLRGRPALLSSWATWCAPCRKELPALERLHQAQGPDGLQVVIVNLDEPTAASGAVQKMVDELGLTMTQWKDPDGTFTTTFRGIAVPMSVLLDASGRVVEKWHGPLDPDDPDVRRRLERVLAKHPGD